MSRKRKQAPSNLLTPQMFLTSVAALNIFAEQKQKQQQQQQPIPIEPSSPSPSPDNTTSNNCIKQNSEFPKQEQVVYSNEAIELLRQCHGQFISLVSSELASCERIGKKKKKKTKLKTEDDKEEEIVPEPTPESKVVIRSIVPKHVLEGLDNLEFHDIASKVRILMKNDKKLEQQQQQQPCSTRNNVKFSNHNGSTTNETKSNRNGKSKIINHTDDGIGYGNGNDDDQQISKNVKTTTKKATRRKKKKIKNALKDDAMTAELLKEQEKLFALSASRAKLSQGK